MIADRFTAVAYVGDTHAITLALIDPATSGPLDLTGLSAVVTVNGASATSTVTNATGGLLRWWIPSGQSSTAGARQVKVQLVDGGGFIRQVIGQLVIDSPATT